MDKTNLLLISTNDICELDEMFGNEQERLEMYNEMLSCNDEEPISEWAQAVDDYALEVASSYYEDFLDEYGNLEVLAIGDLGLWYGRTEGGLYGTLRDMLSKAVEDYNSLYYDKENKTFKLKAVHHDGTNYFTFYALTEKGKNYLNNNPRCAETHQYVINTKGYTKQIKF